MEKHVELLPTFSGSSTAFVAGEGSGRLDQQLTSVPKYPCTQPLPQPGYEAIPKVYKVICFTDTYNLGLTAVFFYRPALLCSAQIQARLTADCIEDFINSSLTVMVVWYSHALKQQCKVTVTAFL